MRQTDSARKRAIIYIATAAFLFIGYFLLRGWTWQGTKQLHTIMEIVATLLASAVGVLALIRFHTKKNNTILFIGTAFLGAAFLDGYHAVVTSTFFDAYFPSVPSSLIPWSWIASRLFLSVFLYLGYLAWRREKTLGEEGRIGERTVYWAAAIATLASFIFFAFVPLPRAYYPEIFFHRPEEFFPAIFFFLALAGYLKKGEWKSAHFEHWLVMSIIVGFMSQVMFMSTSEHLFDLQFDAAHLLKKVSYVFVLTGLLINMSRLFQQAEETAAELEVSSTELREANERLEIVGTIARAVGSSLRQKDLFPTIAREIRQVIPCERVFIGSVNFETEDVFYWYVESDIDVQPVEQDDISRLEWYRDLYEKSRPLKHGDLRKVSFRRARDFASAGLRSQLVVPIERDGRCFAHIALSSTRVDAFSDNQVKLLVSLSTHINVALRNASLLQEAEKRATRLATLVDVTQRLTRELDLTSVLNSIAESAASLFDGEAGIRILEGDELVKAAATPGADNVMAKKEVRMGESITGQVAASGQAIVTSDASTDARLLHAHREANREARTGALMCVPVGVEGRILGTLHIYRERGHQFGQSATRLAMSLADQAAVAIQKAKFIEDLTSHAERLELSEGRLRSILDSAQDAIITIDQAGFVTLFNPAAERMFGYASEEVHGQDANILIPSIHLIEPDIDAEEADSGGPVRTLEARRKNGSVFPIELSMGEVTVEGAHFFTGIIRDITERHEIDRMKNEFISVVSHEIKTPLTSLRGSLGLMEGGIAGDLSDQGKELLAIAVNNTERLIRLISDILDLEKIESGNMELHFASCPLEDLVDRAMEEMRGLTAESGIDIEKNTEACLVDVDSDSIIQVLVNLISNAVKFSDPGGSIVISSRCMEGEAEIRVEDTGRGIPRDALDGIFDRFRQVDSSDQREKGGSGLGLAICSAIVAQHGGRIWVESEPDEGSIFFFTLPRTEPAPRRTAPPGEAVKSPILVCEDDRDFIRLMQLFLEKEGYSVIPTFSAEEALAYLEENEVAAVVMDVNLPGMSGIDMLNVIKGYPETRRPLVIVVSVEEQVDIPDLPAPFLLDWITKPLDEHRLRSRLKAALKLAKAATALVVDDDPDLREVVKRLLETRNIRVETAASGFEAVEKFRNTGPDLLILDIVMPEGDGFFVMDTLRQELELRKVPIIVYSAEAPTSGEKKRLAMETTLFLTKLKTPQDEFIGHVVEMLNGLLTDSPYPG